MPIEQHPTKPDTFVFRGHPAALMWTQEEKIDTSPEHVHVSNKNVHVPLMRELNEAESSALRMAGFNPEKFRRVLAFNDKPCPFGAMCEACNPKGGTDA